MNQQDPRFAAIIQALAGKMGLGAPTAQPGQLPSFPLAPAAPGGMPAAPGFSNLPGKPMPGVSKSAIQHNRMLQLPGMGLLGGLGSAQPPLQRMPGSPMPPSRLPTPFVESFLPGANNRRKAL